ncbi:MAG: GNAT family N-acetyltransferase [Candidatus Krumholzibacteria bacterium]|nr:GNAT family N-acetyltransferase [Candidatus Krumholzibacteria bacterium]MDH4335803.1 GNAT family N-acetyltransferase [Candidatus Krumholzibacteria bacterium]MDH5269329.1 GNAT family N-acetyltransferase [Candidatus Krumholzibacteria bacterium]MDH5628057.1 GNAT family N-acetyltransferase [Candidatus Krumholzibacteria bacterium]
MKIEPVRIQLTSCLLREFRKGDEPSLVRHANNRNIWINVRDSFPYPYRQSDARAWVRLAGREGLNQVFAIDVDGFVIGAIGVRPREDVNALSGEIGYWLGEEFWNRGITTEAVVAVTRYAFEEMGMIRLYAEVFEWNVASMRVLEKAGFTREGTMRRSAVKNRQVIDQVLFAKLRE